MCQHRSPGSESSTRLQGCVEPGHLFLVLTCGLCMSFVLVHKCSTRVAFTAAEGASQTPPFHTLGHLFYPLTQHYNT